MQKMVLQSIIFIRFWDCFMFYQIFFSLQVKWCPTIFYKHGIYELSHELFNELRLTILGNQDLLGHCPGSIEWWFSAQCLRQNKNFVKTGKEPKNSN